MLTERGHSPPDSTASKMASRPSASWGHVGLEAKVLVLSGHSVALSQDDTWADPQDYKEKLSHGTQNDPITSKFSVLLNQKSISH